MRLMGFNIEIETNIELENNEGWQCQELRQHNTIKKLF